MCQPKAMSLCWTLMLARAPGGVVNSGAGMLLCLPPPPLAEGTHHLPPGTASWTPTPPPAPPGGDRHCRPRRTPAPRYLSSETLMTPSSLGTIAAMFTTSCEPSTLLSRRGLRVSALGWGSAAMGPAGTAAAAAGGGYGRGREGGRREAAAAPRRRRDLPAPGALRESRNSAAAPPPSGQGRAGPGGALGGGKWRPAAAISGIGAAGPRLRQGAPAVRRSYESTSHGRAALPAPRDSPGSASPPDPGPVIALRLPAARPRLLRPPGGKKPPLRVKIKQNVAAKVAASFWLRFSVLVLPGSEGNHGISAAALDRGLHQQEFSSRKPIPTGNGAEFQQLVCIERLLFTGFS